MLEPIIPDEWELITDKKLSDFIDMSGENVKINEDECPIYFDRDTEGYIYLVKETFGGEEMMAAYRVARRPNDDQTEVEDVSKSDDPMARMGQGFCPPFNTHTYEAAPGIICMQDQPVVMRDGTIIYADIYRPEGDVKVPTIVSWSWFGKRPGDGMSEWQIMGVPPQTVSKCAKFESPDPLYWCHYGYAVANVDVRGAGHSEGNVHMFTHQDREDGYDFVEWVAEQPWRVTLVWQCTSGESQQLSHHTLLVLRLGNPLQTSIVRASLRVVFQHFHSISSSLLRLPDLTVLMTR